MLAPQAQLMVHDWGVGESDGWWVCGWDGKRADSFGRKGEEREGWYGRVTSGDNAAPCMLRGRRLHEAGGVEGEVGGQAAG
jgi:hypothetical protein